MANESKTGYFLAGLTVIAATAAFVAALAVLGGRRGGEDLMLVETSCAKPVAGLSAGSAVNFRGVKVGEVREISFIGSKYRVDDMDKLKIYILMAIDRKRFGIGEGADGRAFIERLVANGLRATVSASGITGLSRVECDIMPSRSGSLPTGWTPEQAYIPSEPSLLESFSDAATRAMNQINRMDFGGVWSNVSESVGAASATLAALGNMISSRQGDIERILLNLEEATAALKDFAEAVRNNPARILSGDDPAPLPETRR
jgi:paraquat-inducible protein B